MWAQQIVGSLNKVFTQFKNTWGYALATLNYRQMYGQWKTVTRSAEQVAATAIATPEEGGSIEITDLFFNAIKAAGSTVTITMTDGTNTETLISILLTNDVARVAHSIQGRMQGWADDAVKYTVADANSSGEITLGYVKHSRESTDDYDVWNSRR